ncbi:MAG: hydroxyacid dehydrogenase [Clostridia bacterium]|nr:hydroxyacid dehydrogenase [Clostridia bacterium]
MKSVIMTERPQNIDAVYSDDLKKKISEATELLAPVCSRDEFFARADEMKKVEIIFSTWGMLKLTCEQIKEYLPSLRAVFYAAGTVQYFARPFIECGVRVFSAWAANSVPVAEIAASEIILANKGFFRRRVHSREEWKTEDPSLLYPGNFKTKVGLLGAGMIGKGVIRNLAHTDLDIYVFDPFLPDNVAKSLGVTKKDLDWIFENCNVISNHLANNEQTKGMITKKHFDKMGRGAVFINTGRGAQVVEADLIAAMKEVPTRAAILDVTDPAEPPKEDSELYTLPNVFLTPHVAGSIGNECLRMGEYMWNEFSAYQGGGQTKYEVTAQMLETMA